MRTSFTSTLLTASTLVWLAAMPVLAQPLAPAGGPGYVPGEVLVQFKSDATDVVLLDAVRRGGLVLERTISSPRMRAQGKPGLNVARVSRPVPEIIQALQGHPGIDFVEPNWIYQPSVLPSNDPDLGDLWGMGGGLGCNAAAAWNSGFTGSDEVVVAVIDTGVDINHSDLAANIWTNPGETPGNGVDDDGNGYADDMNGWDFDRNDNSVYDGRQDDHGTHVGGTIGGVGNNGIGVVGVNWRVKLLPAKFLGRRGGTTENAIRAVDYIEDLKTRRGVNIVAINASWGGGGFSQGLLDAIKGAADAQILFVAAAGNGDFFGFPINNDTNPHYPSSYVAEDSNGNDAVIAVTAIDAVGNKASWANYGVKSVDLGAPGVGILSTLPTDSYGSYSGTSMATPHVTGAAALYKAANPSATAPQIRSALVTAAKPTTSLSGITLTGSRLDLSTMTGSPSDPGGSTTVNRAPTSNDQTVTANVGETVNITLTGSDPDGDALIYSVTGTTELGALSGTAPELNYQAGSGTGTDTFAFTVSDGEFISGPATVTIQVIDPNAQPTSMSAEISLVSELKGRNLKGTATVTVTASGAAVQGATVTGTWVYSGLDLETSTGQTDTNGQASLVITLKESDPTALSFRIEDVVKDGYEYGAQ